MKRKLLILIMFTISLTAFCQPSAMYDSADWVNHRARIDSNFTELYDTSVVHNTRLIALENQTSGGSSTTQFKFIVGTTVNAPTAGDDTLRNSAFYNSHIEAWKTNSNVVTNFYSIPITNDSTANFSKVWADGDSVVIDVTETTAWGVGVLTDTSTTPTYGSNLVTNGTFDSDINSWTNVGEWAWQTDGSGGGWARKTAGNAFGLNQLSILTIGVEYYLEYIIGGVTAGSVVISLGNTGDTSRSSDGSYSATITAGSDAHLRMLPSTDFNGYVDTIIVREVL